MQFQEYYKTLYDLQAYKITNVLFISSPYEAFVFEEDGSLSESVADTYNQFDLNLTFTPRITYATTEKKAMDLLEKRSFDLVVNTLKISDIDNENFCKNLKIKYPKLPHVVLTSSKAEIPNDLQQYIDASFLWQGNPRIFFAMTKLVEDMLNVERDVKIAGVKVILVVEDSIEYYSLFLPKLYREIMAQTQRLVSTGVTSMRRLFKARARPKILLAKNYEEAKLIIKTYKKDLIGLISDIGFPIKNKLEHDAGFLLAKELRKIIPDLPVILNSSDSKNKTKTMSEGFMFLDKNSTNILEKLEEFIMQHLGFGDFVFRKPNGEELARASDLLQLADEIEKVSDESLIFHSAGNHFSIWLMARGEFLLAKVLRPQKIENFINEKDLRNFLVKSIRRYLADFQESVVADVTQTDSEKSYNFLRLSTGFLGGKAMGLAFVNYSLSLNSFKNIKNKFLNINIKIPKTRIIATDEFDLFIKNNKLAYLFTENVEDSQITKKVLASHLSEKLILKLSVFLDEVRAPIAVRSSGLLEDSATQAFAGIYATYMLPNNDNDLSARLENLTRAIKLVYASVFFNRAKTYAQNSSKKIEQEKMSVVLQEVIGKQRENMFFPDISGTLKTFNFFPPQGLKATDGIVSMALGLGKTITDGGEALSIYPKRSGVLSQFNTIDSALKTTQKYFYAINLNETVSIDNTHCSEDINLEKLRIKIAENLIPYFNRFASTFVAGDNRIKPGIFHDGARIISFYDLLNSDDFPFYDFMNTLMRLSKSWFGSDVEMEFAIKIDEKRKQHEFYVLQIRPMVNNFISDKFDISPTQNVLIQSNKILGNVYLEDVKYIVYVKEDEYSNLNNNEIAEEIKQINLSLDDKAIFVSFGRWGSSDHYLGLPVAWEAISNAVALIELNREDFTVDLSYGSHFFHNISSMNIGYMAIDVAKKKTKVDWSKIYKEETVIKETKFVKVVTFKKQLCLLIDARKKQGSIFLKTKK